jgi:hypothetical protein
MGAGGKKPLAIPRDSMTKKERKHLSDLWSEYIRKRAMMRVHACERCLTWKSGWKELDGAHCFTRNSRTTQFDPRNGAGLCGACHMYIDNHESAKFELFRRLIGDSHEFEMLYAIAHLTSKQSPVDYKMTEIYLKTLIKQLDGVVATT